MNSDERTNSKKPTAYSKNKQLKDTKCKDNFIFIHLYYDRNQKIMFSFVIAHFVKDVRNSKCMTHTKI